MAAMRQTMSVVSSLLNILGVVLGVAWTVRVMVSVWCMVSVRVMMAAVSRFW